MSIKQQDPFEIACNELAKLIIENNIIDKHLINQAKLNLCKKYRIPKVPNNSEILKRIPSSLKEKYLDKLCIKKVRAISGINVISVMTKPIPCPHGRCAYCPSEPGVPLSYTGHEPASMRGIQNNFDPHKQITARIQQLESIGHRVSKIELIIQGGTFTSMPKDYQEYFIKRCLDAVCKKDLKNLIEAKKNAENSDYRVVGITIETRPDWINEDIIDHLLFMGVTRIEMGVQNLYDNVYKIVERGHEVKDVIKAFRIAKDAGYKIVAHMMPGLPGSNFEKDFKAFERLFSDPNFKPDMLKIYPCLVLSGTKIHAWWSEGIYKPYTTEEAVDLIAKVKSIIPRWVRVMRVQRDIPSQLIIAGPKKSNLRQLVEERMKELGLVCKCIRCREVGHKFLKHGITPNPNHIEILREEYEASKGEEIFISVEDTLNDILIGYLRLRIPSKKAHRLEISNEPSSIVRELRVFG
ncbi:MAG: tRNA uridine(34) 5-carboxymethylaminomethyl modification radical SAM/GNAT enzyme Elp3, partial [Candidatus Bathyarchaeia archaeon]